MHKQLYKRILYLILTLVILIAAFLCLQQIQNISPTAPDFKANSRKLANFLNGKSDHYDGYDMQESGSYDSAVEGYDSQK
jgi:hypothetical protein